MRSGLQVFNPLPIALHHYTMAVCKTLGSLAIEFVLHESRSTEASVAGDSPMVARAAHAVRERRRFRADHVLALWPGFGDLDFAVWRLARSTRVDLIWHDPRPIHKSRYSGLFGTRIGQQATSGRDYRILVHSQTAKDDLEELGWHVDTVVPHPVRLRRNHAADRKPVALVAGQYKATRDIDLMVDLAPLLCAAGFHPRVVGRGWPQISGWEVDSRFLTEDELDRELATCTVVLLPYQRVYQSGIAVRAAELHTPVVGGSETNIVEIFGTDWIGALPAGSRGPRDWALAAHGAAKAGEPALHDRLLSWQRNTDAAWRTTADMLDWPSLPV